MSLGDADLLLRAPNDCCLFALFSLSTLSTFTVHTDFTIMLYFWYRTVQTDRTSF